MYKLIVFIDALPYEYRENFKNFSHKQNLKINKLIPGYGFSSNQHNMLLRGLLPDKVGFFTDYEITEKKFGH